MSPWGDERAQSVQVGVIILFAFAVLAFSGYQATVVPQQNQGVEFEHSQQIAKDVQTFRNDLLDAAASGQRFSAEFALGTTYPPRIIALNPAPASGSLRTEALGSGEFALVSSGKSLEDVCGYDRDGDGTVRSNGLVYRPSYNFYQEAPTVVYENTVSYRRFARDDTVRFDSGQTLVQGSSILIPPLLGNVSASSSMTHTVDLYPGKAGVGESVGQRVKLVVPTALSADRWQTLLSDQMTPDGHVESVTPNGSNVDIVLESGEYQITCPVMGVGKAPTNSPDQLRGEGDGINPGGPGDVRLSDVELHPDDKDVVVTSFTNPGDDVNITNVRFNFYDAGTQSGPAQMDMANYTRSTTTIDNPPFIQDLKLRGAPQSPDPHADLEGGDAVTAFAMEFENADDSTYDTKQDHFAVVFIRFSDGQSANYFVDMPETSNTVANDPPTASFTYSPSNPSVGEQVTFDASGSSDPDGSITSYDWQWGDGNAGSGETATHSYSSSGTYDVTLTVTDDSGDTDSVTEQVTVGSGGGGGDTTPPSVNIDSTSTTGGRGHKYDVTVDWSATDNVDLSGGSVNRVRLYDSSGSTIDTIQISPSGTSDSGSVTFNDAKSGNEDPSQWSVTVTISDSSDNQGSATKDGL